MSSSSKLRPAEQVFADEWARLDREDPGWDDDGKIAAIESLLQSGTSRDLLVKVYGEELVKKANVTQGPGNKDHS